MRKNETKTQVNKTVQLKVVGAFAVAMLTLTGCTNESATPPTTGDFMRMHAADGKEMSIDQKEIAARWDKGSKQVKEGEELVKAGNNDMTNGKEKVEKGNQAIAEGTKIKDENEALFYEKYPDQKLDLK